MAQTAPLNRIGSALAAALSALSLQRVALVGGLAVSARSEPRFTRDIDLAVAVENDRQAEDLVRELTERGYVVLAVLEQERAGRLATVRLRTPGECEPGVVLDLLFASCGVEPELVAAADPLEIFPGIVVPVARVGHLLAMKVLSVDDRRPQDAADLCALRAEATAGDVALARAAVRLIAQRGFDRGRDVVSLLEQALQAP